MILETKMEEPKHPIKYQYDSEEEYLVNHYTDKTLFAKYNMERQLLSATTRQKDLEFELKLFGGAWAAMILLLPIGAIMCIASFILAVMGGALLVVACIFALIVLLPYCIYKTCRALLVLGINKQNAIGQWAVKKFSLTVYKSEVQQCQEYSQRYTLLLEDLSEWKEALSRGEPVDAGAISKRVSGIDFDPEIKVTNPNSGELKQFSRKISIVVSIITYILLFLAGKAIYMAIFREWLYMFQQV